ncbi:tyrosine-type recombinase/integrase [Desnuesiella massiliensis]|uniref:tyrosine-type recombinase/integrase n=1 Tax=Desnuesiella massiliensis TaxID=1650662 RepID=UPI0006E2DDE3|nr:tyrosine-type recombinase/integrase [Desnuesiella massiliensis]
MEGSVTSRKLKNGKVVYDIAIDLPRKADGSRNQLRKRGFKTKKEAQLFIADTIMKVTNGHNFSGDKILLKNYLEKWLKNEESSLSPSTQKRYREFCVHISNHLGQVPIGKLTGLQIKEFYQDLENPQEYSNFRKGLSRSTILKIHRMLHKALTDAVRDGTIDRTIISNIKYGRVEKTQTEVWDNLTCYLFLEKIKDELLYLPVLIAFETGLRQSEITGLKWDDINIEKGLLTVKRNYSYDDSKKSLSDKKTKTKSSIRTIILFDNTIKHLKNQRQKQRLNKILLGESYIDSGYVCTNSIGNPIDPHYISKRFAKAIKKHNFKKIRFHDLRHSHATLLLKENIHPKIVSERLGHSSISITLDTYTHVSTDIERAALLSVNKKIIEFIEEKESI